MLYLTRKRDESIMIGDDIEITVTEIRGNSVKLGLNFPKSVSVLRREIYDRIQEENRAALSSADSTEDLLGDLGNLIGHPDDRKKP